MSQKLMGIIPPMTTPFDSDENIDTTAFRQEVRYLIDAGVHGVAVGGSTGEGHTLTTEEIRCLTEIALEESAGRIPVITGIIVDSTRQAIDRGRAVADLPVAALQITPVHYLFAPDDEAMYRHFAAIADAVELPILIYNVIPWSYCSPQLLARIINEIELVIGVKQSAGDMHALAELLLLLQGRGLVMAAVDDLLYPCFTLGCHGSIAAILTAVPKLCVSLWDAVKDNRYDDALNLHNRLLRIWNAIAGSNLPACVKCAMNLQGRPGGATRAPMPAASPAQESTIRTALQVADVLPAI
ncbi:TPA: dihydrodipicolinate synthase family protein [Candidatus Poribacteria bacterium]|nr:dihydrodipicolinate synthase family protein [Candidatus Poribacteria bacterium]